MLARRSIFGYKVGGVLLCSRRMKYFQNIFGEVVVKWSDFPCYPWDVAKYNCCSGNGVG